MPSIILDFPGLVLLRHSAFQNANSHGMQAGSSKKGGRGLGVKSRYLANPRALFGTFQTRWHFSVLFKPVALFGTFQTRRHLGVRPSEKGGEVAALSSDTVQMFWVIFLGIHKTSGNMDVNSRRQPGQA